MSNKYKLAIDFGTSNTTAAVWRAGEPRPVPLRLGEGGNAIASCVMLRDGEWLVGDDAAHLAQFSPRAFERTPKRRLDEERIALGTELVAPVDAVSAVLSRVLKVAESQSEGDPPEQVVLTHPVPWTKQRVDLLIAAMAATGYPSTQIRLVQEPIAAAFNFVGSRRWEKGDQIAVVDFGGGTFDASVIKVDKVAATGPVFDVVAAKGEDPLGGDDFDASLEDWVFTQLDLTDRQELAEYLHSEAGLAARLTLRDEVRRAKHTLSNHADAPIVVAGRGDRVLLNVTVDEFEDMIRPQIETALETAEALLRGSDGSGLSSLKALYLTGGSSLIPLVQREFQQLAVGRVATLGDPKEVTALGALVVPEAAPEPKLPPPEKPKTKKKEGEKKPGSRKPTLKWALIPAALVLVLVSLGLSGGLLEDEDPPDEEPTTQPLPDDETPPDEDPPPDEEPAGDESEACLDGTAAQCALAVEAAADALAEPDTCFPVEGTTGVSCLPAFADEINSKDDYIFVDALSGPALKREPKAVIGADGLDPATFGDSYGTWPYAGVWNYDDVVAGDLYAYKDHAGGWAKVLWTDEAEGRYYELGSKGTNVADVTQWWDDNV